MSQKRLVDYRNQVKNNCYDAIDKVRYKKNKLIQRQKKCANVIQHLDHIPLSMPGPVGPKGDRGERGLQGLQGPQGEPGGIINGLGINQTAIVDPQFGTNMTNARALTDPELEDETKPFKYVADAIKSMRNRSIQPSASNPWMLTLRSGIHDLSINNENNYNIIIGPGMHIVGDPNGGTVVIGRFIIDIDSETESASINNITIVNFDSDKILYNEPAIVSTYHNLGLAIINGCMINMNYDREHPNSDIEFPTKINAPIVCRNGFIHSMNNIYNIDFTNIMFSYEKLVARDYVDCVFGFINPGKKAEIYNPRITSTNDCGEIISPGFYKNFYEEDQTKGRSYAGAGLSLGAAVNQSLDIRETIANLFVSDAKFSLRATLSKIVGAEESNTSGFMSIFRVARNVNEKLRNVKSIQKLVNSYVSFTAEPSGIYFVAVMNDQYFSSNELSIKHSTIATKNLINKLESAKNPNFNRIYTAATNLPPRVNLSHFESKLSFDNVTWENLPYIPPAYQTLDEFGEYDQRIFGPYSSTMASDIGAQSTSGTIVSKVKYISTTDPDIQISEVKNIGQKNRYDGKYYIYDMNEQLDSDSTIFVSAETEDTGILIKLPGRFFANEPSWGGPEMVPGKKITVRRLDHGLDILKAPKVIIMPMFNGTDPLDGNTTNPDLIENYSNLSESIIEILPAPKSLDTETRLYGVTVQSFSDNRESYPIRSSWYIIDQLSGPTHLNVKQQVQGFRAVQKEKLQLSQQLGDDNYVYKFEPVNNSGLSVEYNTYVNPSQLIIDSNGLLFNSQEDGIYNISVAVETNGLSPTYLVNGGITELNRFIATIFINGSVILRKSEPIDRSKVSSLHISDNIRMNSGDRLTLEISVINLGNSPDTNVIVGESATVISCVYLG